MKPIVDPDVIETMHLIARNESPHTSLSPVIVNYAVQNAILEHTVILDEKNQSICLYQEGVIYREWNINSPYKIISYFEDNDIIEIAKTRGDWLKDFIKDTSLTFKNYKDMQLIRQMLELQIKESLMEYETIVEKGNYFNESLYRRKTPT